MDFESDAEARQGQQGQCGCGNAGRRWKAFEGPQPQCPAPAIDRCLIAKGLKLTVGSEPETILRD